MTKYLTDNFRIRQTKHTENMNIHFQQKSQQKDNLML